MFFKRYSIENGLSQNSIHAIVQDKSGFIWIATENGLNRFDGYQFKTFFPDFERPNSLISASVFDIKVDEQNRLWLATDAGISCFNQQDENFYSFPHLAKYSNHVTKNAIKKLLIDTRNKLWVLSRNGLYKSINNIKQFTGTKQDQDTALCFKIKSLRNDLNLFDIIEDKNGSFWIASQKGIYIIDAAGNNITNKELGDVVYDKLKTMSITALLETGDKRILIASLENLFVFSPQKKRIKKLKPEYNFGQINTLYKDKKKQIWIGTKNQGLFCYNNSNEITQYKNTKGSFSSLSGNRVLSIYVDYSNSLFVGDNLNGLSIAHISKKPFQTFRHNPNRNSLASNVVRAIYAEENDAVWFGLDTHGLDKYTASNNEFKHYPLGVNGGSPTVKVICAKNQEELYLSTINNGLILFNKKTEEFQCFVPKNKMEADSFNYLFGLQKDPKGNLWIGSWGGGLYEYKIDDEKFVHYHNLLINNNITSLFLDNNDTLWISTWGGGFFSYNIKTNTHTNYFQENEKKSIPRFTSSFCKTGQTLWIGTSLGLLKYNLREKTYELFNRKQGLISEYVYALQKDRHGNIWLSTNKGLFKFNIKKQNFQNFDFKDNIQDNEFNTGSSYAAPNGNLFFGGINGFTMFRPQSIKNSLFQAKTNITNIYLNNTALQKDTFYNNQIVLNKSISYTSELQLNRRNNNFTFEFSSTDYSRPEKIQFKYRLSPYEKNWNNTWYTKRFATYTGIPPGDYTFELKASNADGVWNDKIKHVHIIIQPAFWQTAWFKVLVVLVVLLLFTLFYKLRLRILKKQKAYLEQLVSQKTTELEQSMYTLLEQKKELSETNTLLEEKHEEVTQQSEELRIISKKLKVSNLDLELKVKKRTKKLNIALDDSKKAEKLIASFLSNMSHEIRTPMNAISGFSQLITQIGISNEQREHYNHIINQSVDSLLEQIDNIMYVSKMHSGTYVMMNNLFSLNMLFKELLEDFNSRKELQNTNVSLRWQQPETPNNINLLADKQVFKQIVYQLVSNALKYTEKGEVVFGYELQRKVENTTGNFKIADKKTQTHEASLTIFVNDTGVGIDKKQQQYIFDAFKKIEGKEKLFRGSGLGLAIVKNLCDSINAKIELKSELNKGSVFTIKLALSNN